MRNVSLHARLLGSCASVILFAGIAQSALADSSDGDRLETVTVTGIRYQEAAREMQRDAPNIIDVQSAEAMLKYPDFNAANRSAACPAFRF